eukprot:874918-Rhodomonas_salina.1
MQPPWGVDDEVRFDRGGGGRQGVRRGQQGQDVGQGIMVGRQPENLRGAIEASRHPAAVDLPRQSAMLSDRSTSL